MSENDKKSGRDSQTGSPSGEPRKRKRTRRGGRGRRKSGEGDRAQASPGNESRRRRTRSGEGRSRPAEGKPAEGRPIEGKPAEGRPTESKSVEGKSAEGKPARSRRRSRSRADSGRSGEAEPRRRRRRRREASEDSTRPDSNRSDSERADQESSSTSRSGEGRRRRRRRRSDESRRTRRAGADSVQKQTEEPDLAPGEESLFTSRGEARALAPDRSAGDADEFAQHPIDQDEETRDQGTRDEGARDDSAEDDFFDVLEPPEGHRIDVPEPDDDDPDPLSLALEHIEVDERQPLVTRVRNVVGVKFSSAGRIDLFDSGDKYYKRGEAIVVEGERGMRVGTVAVPSMRTASQKQNLKRALRRPNRHDRQIMERNKERGDKALAMARTLARELELPMKVFRAAFAHSGKKVNIYYTSEKRIDFRDMVRRLTAELHCRVEMRQTGVRDEAKFVGGIGSCGRELCCTTWLPDFVPVSIKMAKVQGMVLNPTKVSGQCGRLKCCLVYEQATYAAMRKGLPKLGKRVLTAEGEGRVVEVDVLRQRVRVSLGPGEFRVLPGSEVTPMFPSQPGKPRK